MLAHSRRFALLCAAFVLLPASAFAAVTCVMNGATGKYEARPSSPPSPSPSPACAMQSAADLHHALSAKVGEPVGTRVVDGIFVTNAATLPTPAPAAQVLAARSPTSPSPRPAPAAATTTPDLTPTAKPLGAPDTTPKPTTWEVLATDIRLATTFERWAKAAGYKIQWDATKHVLISATPVFSGEFEDAIRQALSTPAILYSAYPLEACRYEQTPPLIRITRQGEQAKDCPESF